MADQWQWWRDALAGKVAPINADEPAAGFYETRSKNRQTGAETRGVVAYWYVDGKLFCKNGTGMLDDLRARERWPYASKRPITKETYDAVRAGKPWPDEHPAAVADRANTANMADPESFDGLKDRIDDLAREAERLIKAGGAKTKEASDQAADLADRLLKLEKAADKQRDTEKRPHMDAATAVQKKWAPLVNLAADAKARLKRLVITPFLTAADNANRVAEAAAIQRGAPEAVTPIKTTSGTTATVGLRTVTSAVIEDWGKALAYFANNAKVRELVQQLADQSARAGTCPDGCKINTDKVAA